MFSIGFGELAVICIVLIIAVGPERLPGMMKTVGKTMRSLRQASRDIRTATGIDDLMREDFYAQPKPTRPLPPQGPGPVSRGEALAPPSFEALAAARQGNAAAEPTAAPAVPSTTADSPAAGAPVAPATDATDSK